MNPANPRNSGEGKNERPDKAGYNQGSATPTAEIISELDDSTAVVSCHGRPPAVLVSAGDFDEMERALEEAKRRQVLEIVEAGLRNQEAGAPHPMPRWLDHLFDAAWGGSPEYQVGRDSFVRRIRGNTSSRSATPTRSSLTAGPPWPE
jgi:hypothetical protein